MHNAFVGTLYRNREMKLRLYCCNDEILGIDYTYESGDNKADIYVDGELFESPTVTGAEERRQKMQPLSIERDVRRNGIRMDCVFEGTAFDAAREQVRTLRLSGTKLSQISEQMGMPVEQVMDYCRELGLPEIGSCHLVPPGRMKERRCPVCGRIIGQSGRGAPRKYCSDECYAEYERRNYKREKAGRVAFCQNCGRPFILKKRTLTRWMLRAS